MGEPAHPKDFSKVPPLGAFPESAVLERLPDGLLLRTATLADTEALVAFNTAAHTDPPDFSPVPWVGAWTRDLVTGRHPRSQASDFTVVEEPATKRLVSTLCLIDHDFEYEDVRFPAGQVEVVATDPAYRGRRLVARQFEAVHRWSAERQQALTVIDGIPWFYRQFGYELAVSYRPCEAAGAQYVINHRDDNVVAAIMATTDGRPVDRIVDVEFGANLPVSIEVLRVGGTIATYSSTQVSEPKLPFFQMMYKDLTVRLVIVYAMPETAKQHAIGDIDGALIRGSLQHRIAHTLPLSDIVVANEIIEQGSIRGAVVLMID